MQVAFNVSPSLADLRKKYEKIPDGLEKNIGEALQKSALTVEGEAKKATPVDTGRLRASIYTLIERLSATIQPKTNYALFVHEGTKKLKGRPFMIWGLDNSKSQIKKYFDVAVKESLK